MTTQRGNILFLILLAVVLFAALSYAVTSGMRGGGTNASRESAQSAASSIMQYLTLVRTEVQRLMLVNGCTIENIDFRTSTYKTISGATMNSTAPSVPKTGCALFASQGGSLSAQSFDTYEQAGYVDYYTTANPGSWRPGHFTFRWVDRINEGTTADDIAILGRGIRDDVCAAMLSPSNPPAALPNDNFTFGTSASSPEPTISAGLLGDDPANQYGDVFAINHTDSSRISCMFGMILVTR